MIARPIARKLGESMGQPMVVENRPGAGGVIGSGIVAKAEPNGYTLLLTFNPPHNTTPLFSKNVPYDTVKDFTPIILVVTSPLTLVVNSSFPVNSTKELIAYARTNPGKISYGTPGVGTGNHFAGELLKFAGNLDIVHVPYHGGGHAVLIDLLADRIPMGILALSVVLPHTRSGKLRALAVLESKRTKLAPELPTITEGGIPEYSAFRTWIGLLGPAGLPRQIVGRINAEVLKAIGDPELVAQFEAAGFEVQGNTAEEFTDAIANDVKVPGVSMPSS